MAFLIVLSFIAAALSTGWCGVLSFRGPTQRLRALAAGTGAGLLVLDVLLLVSVVEVGGEVPAAPWILAPGALSLGVAGLLHLVVVRLPHRPVLGLDRSYLEELMESTSDPAALLDRRGEVLRANQALGALLDRSPRSLRGQPLARFLELQDDDEDPVDRLLRSLAAGRPVTVEAPAIRANRKRVEVSIHGTPARIPGERVASLLLFRDVTEQHLAETTLRSLETAVETMQLGVTITDLDGRIVYTNPADAAMHGYTPEELLGKDVRIFAPPGTWDPLRPDELENLHRWSRESVNVRRDGERFPVQLMSDVVRGADGEPLGVVTTCQDITERMEVHDRLTRDALYDTLTGLPNRAFLMDLLDRAHRQAQRREGGRFAVLFADLDRFKVVNDTLGHAAGDVLLNEVAQRLKASVRPGDVVARLSGDEFCILLNDLNDPADTTRVAERIHDALQEPVEAAGRELRASLSIGIAVAEDGDPDPDTLLRRADSAMYRAKARDDSRFEVFDEKMHTRAMELRTLETDLRQGLEEAQFHLVYLPVVDLESGRVTSLEALVRWVHPERGELSPATFVSVAEETGTIVPLGWWVLDQACHQMGAWIRRFPSLSGLTVAVNLSEKQLRQPDLLDRVDDALSAAGLEPDRLKLEVKEDDLMADPEAHLPVIRALRERDVQVEIDDFGAASSFVSYLDRFQVSGLKLDPAFLANGQGPDRRDPVIQAVIDLARSLGVRVVAEGVETTAQGDRLRDLRCELGQGYLFSRPLDPDGVERYLADQAEEGAGPA